MSKREQVFAVLPTSLTLGNAFCGFLAITTAAKVGPDVSISAGGHLFYAAVYIYLGMFFDMLDGRVARWTNQTSDFGAQLDSLCDTISFGVAPAFLMLQASKEFHPRFVWIIAALYVMCAILRLARFNVETADEYSGNYFSGLPTPAAAGVIASFPLAMYGIPRLASPDNPEITRFASMTGKFVQSVGLDLLPIVVLALACLMISRIQYAHVFNLWLSGRRDRSHVIKLVFAAAVVFLIREMALPLIFGVFAFGPPVKAAWERWVKPRIGRPPASDAPGS